MHNQKITEFCKSCGFQLEKPRFYCPACGKEIDALQDNSDFIEILRDPFSFTIMGARNLDSQRNIARITGETMRNISVKNGDKIALYGKKLSAGIVKSTFKYNKNQDPIRLSSLMRSNLGKEIGESIKIRKVKPLIAREITIIPYYDHLWFNSSVDNTGVISWKIREKFKKIPLALYDKLFLSSVREMERYLCIAANIYPKGICTVDNRTIINILKIQDPVNFKRVVNTYKHILSIDPKDLNILSSIVKMYLQEENYEKALYYLDEILLIHPKSPFGLTKKGKLLLIQGNNEKAITIFKKVLQLYPESNSTAYSVYNIYLRDCLYYIAVSYARIEKYEQAVSYLNKLLKINQNNKEAIITLGVCYYKLGDSEKGISLIKKALEMEFSQTPEGSHLESLETFGSLYYKFKDRFERIEKTFDSNNFFAWKVLGDIYYKNEKYEEAKDNYLLALKKAPRDSHIWLHLGLIFIHMKEFEQAEKHLKMVLKIDPEAFPAQFGLAGVYYKTQNYDTALELINEVLKHVPDDKHIIKFREKIQNKLKA